MHIHDNVDKNDLYRFGMVVGEVQEVVEVLVHSDFLITICTYLCLVPGLVIMMREYVLVDCNLWARNPDGCGSMQGEQRQGCPHVAVAPVLGFHLRDPVIP